MQIHWIDLSIFIVYLASMLAVGFYFLRKNKNSEDYYVGGRSMTAGHVGLSVVATDVGGGFSIGLGGLGFSIGLSGSWMLFTGILGAWMASVLLIPKVYSLSRERGLLSFPQALEFFYDKRVAVTAGIISLIGYTGFTSSQILAGAKLASGSIHGLEIRDAVLIMGVIAIVYTALGGIKAVIYTDTIQWIILMSGLLFIGLPFAYHHLGGWQNIKAALPPNFLSLTNISMVQFINWMVTIVPIWFIGMTLYQRIYSCKDEKTAVRAWRIAGLFEWPVMAFLGVSLGLLSRVALEQGIFTEMGYSDANPMDPEMGLPIFLSSILPVGLMGLMMSAYFSAILSTADSCLMAASGNAMTDLIRPLKASWGNSIRLSQLFTFLLGSLAVVIALGMTEVLELMLYSYAVMVSGLFVPVMFMIFSKKPSALAALISMIAGGAICLIMILISMKLPYGLDPIVLGLSVSLIFYKLVQYLGRPT